MYPWWSMAYSYDRRASQGIVLYPEGSPWPDEVDHLTRSGHLYRGMGEAEWHFIKSHGVIRSNEKYSIPGEGTNFGDDAGTAMNYANYGRDNPRNRATPTTSSK